MNGSVMDDDNDDESCPGLQQYFSNRHQSKSHLTRISLGRANDLSLNEPGEMGLDFSEDVSLSV
jgi:hypothetical protein